MLNKRVLFPYHQNKDGGLKPHGTRGQALNTKSRWSFWTSTYQVELCDESWLEKCSVETPKECADFPKTGFQIQKLWVFGLFVFHVKTQEDEVSFMPCLYYIYYIYIYKYIYRYMLYMIYLQFLLVPHAIHPFQVLVLCHPKTSTVTLGWIGLTSRRSHQYVPSESYMSVRSKLVWFY